MEDTMEREEKRTDGSVGRVARLRSLSEEHMRRLREQQQELQCCNDPIEEQILRMQFQTENSLRMAEIRRIAKSLGA